MGDRHTRGSAGRARNADGVERMPGASELAADDRFLDDIGAGRRDASGAGVYGTDSHLAALFADARDAAADDLPPMPTMDPAMFLPRRDVVDVEAIPVDEDSAEADPSIENHGFAAAGAGSGSVADASSDADSDFDSDAGAGDSAGAGTVVDGPSSWWKPSRVSSAIIGAAASLALVAGGLSAVHSAGPGSALWPGRVSLFGDQSVEMELASTLEEADAASESGDVERARELLAHAERLMAEVDEADREAMESQMRESEQKVRTVTRTPATVTNERTTTRMETETRDPETVTQTEVVTEVRTETVTRTVGPSTPPSTPSSEPTGEPLSNGQLPLPSVSQEDLPQLPQPR